MLCDLSIDVGVIVWGLVYINAFLEIVFENILIF